jgi:hypothetical protein
MSANGTKRLKGIAYYHCPNRTGCGKYCEMNELEGMVAKEFRKLHFSDEFIQLVIEKTRSKLVAGRDVYEGRRQALVNKRTGFETQLVTLEDKLLNNAIDNDDFKRLRGQTKTKIEDIEEELVRLKNEREVDVDVVQEVLLLTNDIYGAYTRASFDLKRQYLAFFWERFEVYDGVILTAVPAPLFEQLLEAEQAFANHPKIEKALDKAFSDDGILTQPLLREWDVFGTINWKEIERELNWLSGVIPSLALTGPR